LASNLAAGAIAGDGDAGAAAGSAVGDVADKAASVGFPGVFIPAAR
jgi:hypothetical protein